MATRIPVAEGVFTFPSDDPQLIGSKCADCGMVTFPTQASCPRCGSTDTARISEFGSTPCKAQYRCKACLEPFDYFKCH